MGPEAAGRTSTEMNKDTSCGRRNFWVTCDCKSYTTPSCPRRKVDLPRINSATTRTQKHIYAELCLSLDDRSLSLIIRDAKNDGRKALEILRKHYLSSSETRVIGLFTELTTLKKEEAETLTDYVLRGETAAALLKNAGETVSDNLLIAMILKGLPTECQPFVTVTTQRKEPHDITSFKTALRTHEETMKACENPSDNVMTVKSNVKCYKCGQTGHRKFECKSKKHTSERRRWCDYCKSPTHDTHYCRKKLKEHSAKTVTDTNQDQENAIAFKVSVDPQSGE